jgi:hypothetical protein
MKGFIMRTLILAAALVASFSALPALAADELGTPYEKAFETSGKIVDIACEIGGSCPAKCGDGKRQLGVLQADKSLLPIVKGTPLFANALESVLPFCGKTVFLDGLLISNPKMTVYFAQKVKETKDGAWIDTDGFETAFAKKHGKTDEWFRKDPRVAEALGAEGKLGVKGLEIKP